MKDNLFSKIFVGVCCLAFIVLIIWLWTFDARFVKANELIMIDLQQEVNDYYETVEVVKPDPTDFVEVNGKMIAILSRDDIDSKLGYYKAHVTIYDSGLVVGVVEFNVFMNWLYNNGFVIAKIKEGEK